jgi:dienelactone hydrolase
MIGRTLTHYAIDDKVGQGGMGTVYRARDTVLGRVVAIKVLSAEATNDAELGPRMLREAKAASRLNHPNIVTVYELGRSDDTEFLVMEYVEGRSLASGIRQGGLPIDRVIDYSWQIADALAAAHEAGLVHRDMKPGNVMVTPSGRVKVLDFGLARHLPVDAGAETTPATTEFVTRHGVAGTIGYMAPEQIEGQLADARSDVFALGVVIFELLTGQRPFDGDTAWKTMQATVNAQAPDVSRLRPDTPPALVRIVARALARKPEDRYASARELANDLQVLHAPATPATTSSPRRWIAIAAAVIVAIGAVSAAVILWRKSSRVQWARTVAIPEITRDADNGDYDAAYRLARQAFEVIPDDPQLKQLWANVAEDASPKSDPPGADIAVKGYLSTAEWIPLGAAPLQSVKVPFGSLRWRITKSGYVPLEASGAGHEVSTFQLAPAGQASRQMVVVPAGSVDLDTGSVALPEYWIDKYEVTNRQFKQFIDAGGYRTRDFWREPFVKDGRPLDWEHAIAEFHDQTGRPGPSTWEIGAYPDGQDEFPVSGVSWYEAAAYAVFAHKQLPTVYHWYGASGAFSVFSDILSVSNFSGKGTARIGQYGGVGPFGTYDMAGNVKEWCWNSTNAGRRFVLGGAFNDADYQFHDEDAQLPFERRAGFGLRLIEQTAPLEARLTDSIATVERDIAALKPVADAVYQVYVRQFDYDHKPLATTVEATQEMPGWRREKISVAAAYGSERLPLYVFVPTSSTPPYQAVVFFPGSNAVMSSSSSELDMVWADFFIRSGRVLVYPVYQGTYERRVTRERSPTFLRDLTIQRGKDLRRAVDYLESRPDIDRSKIAFYGMSLGAQLGPEWLAIEPRFKTGVFMSGGFETWDLLPEIDPVNYTPHVTMPVLMVNGREDFDLPYETAQVPMFKMLGTPAADKKHAVFEGGHIPAKRQEPIKEMLDWLDKYLGPVRR